MRCRSTGKAANCDYFISQETGLEYPEVTFLLPLRAIGRWLRRTLLVATRRRIEVFWLERTPAPRIPFQLPLRIALVGAPCHAFLTDFEKPGITISRYDFFEQTRDEGAYPQVVVVGCRDLKHALRVLRNADPLRDLPVLMVATGSPWKCARMAASLPDGVALAAISGPSSSGFLDRLPGVLTEDAPLDRAVRNAARETVGKRRGGILILDRYVNQSLRVADLADMAGFQSDRDDTGSVSASNKPPTPSFDALVKHVNSTSAGSPYYPPDFESGRELRVAVMHGLFREGGQRAMPAGATLRIDTDYLVQVHIGGKSESARAPESSTNPPATQQDGAALLEIVLQAKDFQLRSAGTQPVLVPATGPSLPVFFAVRAPLRPGMRQMRVIAYRRNQMLQTSLVDLDVADREYKQGSSDRGVAAKLEFSQTEGFRKLEDIPPRAVTVSVNQDAQGTHSLMIKGHGAAVPLRISESMVNDQLKDYRKRLTDATFVKSNLRVWTSQPNSFSKQFIRELAYQGGAVYSAFFDSYNEVLAETLGTLLTTQDQVISIVRHDPRFAFPWTIFYDYDLPRIKSLAEVCFGKQDGQPCKHDHSSGVCCVRGFWGYRHSIEEIMGNVLPHQRIDSIVRPGRPGDLHYQIDPAASGLSKALLKMAPQATEHILGTDLIQTLWDPNQRPSLLVLLAHLEGGSVPGLPEGPRIQFLDANGATEWFAASDILNQVRRQSYWGQPNSLVLLLNCKSAEISPAMLSNFVWAFHQAHAGAVVGTEVPAYSGLTERFGSEFTRAMWVDGKPLGETLKTIRRILLEEGNPLGFIFTSIGCAELHFS
jgi:hypothetical protein